MVVVMVEGGTFRLGGPRPFSTPSDLEIPSGTMSYQPTDQHTTENIGSAAVHGFLIELRGKLGNRRRPVAQSPWSRQGGASAESRPRQRANSANTRSGGAGSRTRVFRVFVGASPSAAVDWVSGHRHSTAAGGDPSLTVMSR
jgi:hypothetical protein